MAPRIIDDFDEDDFVRTISDTDVVDVPFEEDEEPLLENHTKTAPNGKKRKRRNDEREGLNAVSVNGPTKKSKKERKGPKQDSEPTTNGDVSPEEDEQPWTAGGEDDGAMDSDFEFQIGDIDHGVTEGFDAWDPNASKAPPAIRGDKKGVDIDDIIARRRKGGSKTEISSTDGGTVESEEIESDLSQDPAEGEDPEVAEDDEDETLAEDAFGMGAVGSDEESEDDGRNEDSIPEADSDDETVAEPVSHPDDLTAEASSADEMDDPVERGKEEAFFAPEKKTEKRKSKYPASGSFQTMSLSRPILKGLAAVGFTEPTPIQTKTIPTALMGNDVVGGAVTGSGKTAAFIIPILERLLYRPKKVPTSRVAILMPTRELAVQCFNVAKKLASFTDVTFCQLVGGFSLREQESVLRQRPDVIIATPGRFIDHVRNSASFTVDTLEILVLDEADRMLEDGFADELNEILTTIPKSRQTLLFSATMTSSVDTLIRLGLNKPVRLLVDARKQTVGTLTQEFVRLRPGREDKRLGYLLHLCHTIYTDRVIIFFRQKKEAHRIRIVFSLLGLRATELHGSMSQEQRISALTSFRTGQTTHLLATDLASRGLDIPSVNTVINYSAPQSHEIYLHRVGRTARAGRVGRACTIAAEPDRKVVKQAVRTAKSQGAKIVSRIVEPALADNWAAKATALETEIEEILKEEKEERLLQGAEMQVRKSENLIDHEDEIKARPKRTWFESEREKILAKKKGRVELNGAVGLGKKMKGGGGKLSGKDRKRLDGGRERLEGRVWKKGRGEREGKQGGGGDRKRKGKVGKGLKSKSGGKGGGKGGRR